MAMGALGHRLAFVENQFLFAAGAGVSSPTHGVSNNEIKDGGHQTAYAKQDKPGNKHGQHVFHSSFLYIRH